MASFTPGSQEAIIRALVAGSLEWRTLGEGMALEARRTAPVNTSPDRGGGPHLRDTIEAVITVDSRGPCINLGSRLPQSAYVNKGTVPHPIDPVNAQTLRFRGRGGTIVFAAHVNHPGTKPNDYLMRAARRILGAFGARAAA